MSLRPAIAGDTDPLGRIAEEAGLFPASMMPEIIAPGLGDAPDTWIVAEAGEAPAGFAFARPEEMADRVWNILALAVAPAARRKGLATALLGAMERTLHCRMILIETTQLPDQAAARALYQREGYTEEGRVRDYYALGEDKIIFRKVLA